MKKQLSSTAKFTIALYTARLLGDVDGDGTIIIIDATCIRRKLVDIVPETFIEKAADMYEDKTISVIDATFIQRWLTQLPSNDNIGKPIV